MTTKKKPVEKPIHSAAFWEGWQSFHTRHDCKYQNDEEDRCDWARGFGVAVEQHKAGKVWWKSRTFQVGLVLAGAGVALYFLGQHSGYSNMPMSAVGGGLTAMSLLQMFLRTVTQMPMYFGGSDYSATIRY